MTFNPDMSDPDFLFLIPVNAMNSITQFATIFTVFHMRTYADDPADRFDGIHQC